MYVCALFLFVSVGQVSASIIHSIHSSASASSSSSSSSSSSLSSSSVAITPTATATATATPVQVHYRDGHYTIKAVSFKAARNNNTGKQGKQGKQGKSNKQGKPNKYSKSFPKTIQGKGAQQH